MSIRLQFVAGTAAIVMMGCASTFKATHDYDADHDFSSYQTSAWISKNPMKVSASAGATCCSRTATSSTITL